MYSWLDKSSGHTTGLSIQYSVNDRTIVLTIRNSDPSKGSAKKFMPMPSVASSPGTTPATHPAHPAPMMLNVLPTVVMNPCSLFTVLCCTLYIVIVVIIPIRIAVMSVKSLCIMTYIDS